MIKQWKKPVSAERLREVLFYNSETGIFYWNIDYVSRKGHIRKKGTMAGVNIGGYIRICFDGGDYRA